MGTGDILLRGNPAMVLHPVQGGVAIPLGLFHATETGNKLQPCGPLARVRLNLTLHWQTRKIKDAKWAVSIIAKLSTADNSSLRLCQRHTGYNFISRNEKYSGLV